MDEVAGNREYSVNEDKKNIPRWSQPVLHCSMLILQLVTGVVLLLAGKRLFWLAVGLAGFFIGLQLGLDSFESTLASWLCGVVLGLVGVALAIGLQGILIVLSGLLLGAFAGMVLADLLPPGMESLETITWVCWGVGAVLGGVLALTFFDLGLILLTSIAGAGMILNFTELSPLVEVILLVVLSSIGMLIQTRLIPDKKTSSAPTEKAAKS
jgi:hypothetical protein